MANMRSIPASVLKIDFNYKLAPKIKVHTGHGKPYAPFKSMVGIQNEDNLAVLWKLYPGSEGFRSMKGNLTRLAKRMSILGRVIVGINVDKCCYVKFDFFPVVTSPSVD